MNTRIDLEGSVGAWLHATAGDASPDYLEEIVDRVARVGQRPWWSSPKGWLPMDSPRSRSLSSKPIQLILLLVALLIAVALVAVAIGGGRPSLSQLTGLVPSGPPPPSRSAIEPSPEHRSSPPPSSEPQPTPTATDRGPGSWTLAGAAERGHSFGATMTVLADGRVLVAGGEVEGDGRTSSNAADLYDPSTDRWSKTGSMLYPRHGHSATLLADRRVLVAAGWDYGGPAQASEELYDPTTGTWTATGAMSLSNRHDPDAVTLLDGRVVVIGGCCSQGHDTRRVEVYDPASGRWTSIRPPASIPESATRLADGRVLVLEGADAPEILDPASLRWTTAARPPVAGAQATLLPNGQVLVLASRLAQLVGAELYDPVRDTWSQIAKPATGRGRLTLLGDGTVLVVGHVGSARYDSTTGSWTAVPRPPLPVDYALQSANGVDLNELITLADGRALATEGGAAALFDPNGGG
jgi:Kelch motif protein/galactose oxidase-like protein